MYMKMIESMNAQINSVNVRSSSRARPETVVVYALGRFISRTHPRSASIRSASANPGATDARTETCRSRSRRSISEGLVSRAIFTRLSSRTRPPREDGAYKPLIVRATRRRNIQPTTRAHVATIGCSQTHLHVVVFVDRLVSKTRRLFFTANHQ